MEPLPNSSQQPYFKHWDLKYQDMDISVRRYPMENHIEGAETTQQDR